MCRLPTLPASPDSVLDGRPTPSKSLHTAARTGDVLALLALVKEGAPIDERATSVKWTALHAASALNRAVAVSVLLRYGADPNTFDVDGDTPLITAASLGHAEVVQQLIAKADVMQVSARGETALHVAAEAGFDKIVSLLVARGGVKLTDARTKEGKTASDMANGNKQILKLINTEKMPAVALNKKETLL